MGVRRLLPRDAAYTTSVRASDESRHIGVCMSLTAKYSFNSGRLDLA